VNLFFFTGEKTKTVKKTTRASGAPRQFPWEIN